MVKWHGPSPNHNSAINRNAPEQQIRLSIKYQDNHLVTKMPSATVRTLKDHYVASEKIPAAAFIPRYMDKLGDELFKGREVGVRGFNCHQYDQFSPFLTCSDITVGPPLMFPDHPHCGHDMMLYVIDGR
jgi:hypothetical protein